VVARRLGVPATLFILLATFPAIATAADCTAGSSASDSFVTAEVGCTNSGDTPQEPENSPAEQDPDLSQSKWVPTCPEDPALAAECLAESGCEVDEVPWHRIGNQFGEWVVVASECRSTSPTITPASVATAFRRIPLPELDSITQPAAKTLVNFDTIFYVEAETLDRSIRLLGQDVDLTITPSRFRWTFGDGTDQVTTTPGHAYPAKTVTHRYQRAHVTVEHQVQVTWTATWRVNNGPWQDVPGSVTITGPSTPLRIAEAVPLLTGGDR